MALNTSLAGQRFIIVGGSSGMGLASARLAAASGAEVTLVGRSQDRLDRAAAELDGGAKAKIKTASVDMTDEQAIGEFFAAAGGIDHLIISASSAVHGAFADTDTAAVQAMFDSKFFGPYRVAKAALPYLKPNANASITLFSGVLSRRPGSRAAGLAAVNGAVEALTRALAKELGGTVRVNCISPGLTRTDAYAAMPQDQRETMFAQAAANLPVGRVAEASDIAEAVIMVTQNRFMTGHVLDVDGGALIA